MIADNVICNNCDSHIFVIPGTEVCPKCKMRGSLSWVNNGTEKYINY